MLNRCEFIGNLGADPEVKRMTSGKPVVNLSLAVSEKWKDTNGERKERTEWVRVTVFSEGLCKVAESYLHKGSKVYISGQMQTRKWTDQSGADKYSTEIIMQGFDAKLIMLDGKSDGDSKPSNDEAPRGGSRDLDDDIPF